MPARKFTPPCTPCHQPLSSTVSSSFLTFHLFATAFRSLSLRCPTERFYAKALFEKFAKLAHVCVSACVSVAVMCVCVCVCACAAQSSRCWGNSNREYLRTSHAALPANKPKAANTNLIRAQHEQRESRTRGGRRASGRGSGFYVREYFASFDDAAKQLAVQRFFSRGHSKFNKIIRN